MFFILTKFISNIKTIQILKKIKEKNIQKN
jgi:hypothetical protein